MNAIDFTKVISLFIEKVPKKDAIILAVIFAGTVLIDHRMTLKQNQRVVLETMP